MPLRLPARRRMGPRKADRPFRRRVPPTPQATRLLRVSLGAGLLLLAVLAILFVPIALRYDTGPPPSVVLSLRGDDPFVVEVVRVNTFRPLSDYRAELNITDGTTNVDVDIPQLSPTGSWVGGNVTFQDADGNGRLSPGDRFTIRPLPGTSWVYDLFIFHGSRVHAVGHVRFPA